ncbi:kinase-like domain-containing protein [Lentinula edodes]|nr:kinase-like domain-containing protein [Lentinula edodes]KAJ3921318.1 kinase-like domain-containing protein [Lentinula edodes]
MSSESEEIPHLIANWWLQERLGSGYSGSIFKAIHVHTGKVVALKVQRVDHECPTNRYERGFYPSLQGGVGMPTLWASGVEGMWDYLAIDLLGSSLDSLYRRSGKETMDLRSVCCIAMQVISRLEFMHSRGILHRDIQLGNATIGLPPDEKTIYMIDFGFSKRYIDAYTHRHIPDSKAKRDFIGNYWFSSVGVHCRGKVPSRRDDLEAVALMLIHLLTPRGLSWTRNGVPKTDAAHEILKREKRLARPEDLCRGLPNEFEELLRYCRQLKFQECPDYQQWIDEFRELSESHGFPSSYDFVWPPPKPVKKQSRTMVSTKPKSTVTAADDLANVLNDLGRMNLGDNQTLADRTNVAQAVRQAKQDVGQDSDKRTITISSDSEGQENDTVPPAFMAPKAYKLAKLTNRTSSATDNAALSELVLEFIKVMKSNTSRTLIKDGFAFLDALNKQLEDPSVFVVPMRTRSKDISLQTETSNAKLGVVARLRREVGNAKSNRQLATMVQDFGRVTNRSSGRTITKDGFSFLEGLARQLKTLQ